VSEHVLNIEAQIMSNNAVVSLETSRMYRMQEKVCPRKTHRRRSTLL